MRPHSTSDKMSAVVSQNVSDLLASWYKTVVQLRTLLAISSVSPVLQGNFC